MGELVQFPTSYEPWVTSGHAARHFSVSVHTVRRWIRQGMPAERFHGSRRLRLSECEAWLRKTNTHTEKDDK